ALHGNRSADADPVDPVPEVGVVLETLGLFGGAEVLPGHGGILGQQAVVATDGLLQLGGLRLGGCRLRDLRCLRWLRGPHGGGRGGPTVGEVNSVGAMAAEGPRPATAPSAAAASGIDGRAAGSSASNCIRIGANGPARRGGRTRPSATVRSSARVLSSSPNGG